MMSSEDKKVIQSLSSAYDALPDDKREFLRGYAEGVAAMADRKGDANHGNEER